MSWERKQRTSQRPAKNVFSKAVASLSACTKPGYSDVRLDLKSVDHKNKHDTVSDKPASPNGSVEKGHQRQQKQKEKEMEDHSFDTSTEKHVNHKEKIRHHKSEDTSSPRTKSHPDHQKGTTGSGVNDYKHPSTSQNDERQRSDSNSRRREKVTRRAVSKEPHRNQRTKHNPKDLHSRHIPSNTSEKIRNLCRDAIAEYRDTLGKRQTDFMTPGDGMSSKNSDLKLVSQTTRLQKQQSSDILVQSNMARNAGQNRVESATENPLLQSGGNSNIEEMLSNIQNQLASLSKRLDETEVNKDNGSTEIRQEVNRVAKMFMPATTGIENQQRISGFPIEHRQRNNSHQSQSQGSAHKEVTNNNLDPNRPLETTDESSCEINRSAASCSSENVFGQKYQHTRKPRENQLRDDITQKRDHKLYSGTSHPHRNDIQGYTKHKPLNTSKDTDAHTSASNITPVPKISMDRIAQFSKADIRHELRKNAVNSSNSSFRQRCEKFIIQDNLDDEDSSSELQNVIQSCTYYSKNRTKTRSMSASNRKHTNHPEQYESVCDDYTPLVPKLSKDLIARFSKEDVRSDFRPTPRTDWCTSPPHTMSREDYLDDSNNQRLSSVNAKGSQVFMDKLRQVADFEDSLMGGVSHDHLEDFSEEEISTPYKQRTKTTSRNHVADTRTNTCNETVEQSPNRYKQHDNIISPKRTMLSDRLKQFAKIDEHHDGKWSSKKDFQEDVDNMALENEKPRPAKYNMALEKEKPRPTKNNMALEKEKPRQVKCAANAVNVHSNSSADNVVTSRLELFAAKQKDSEKNMSEALIQNSQPKKFKIGQGMDAESARSFFNEEAKRINNQKAIASALKNQYNNEIDSTSIKVAQRNKVQRNSSETRQGGGEIRKDVICNSVPLYTLQDLAQDAGYDFDEKVHRKILKKIYKQHLQEKRCCKVPSNEDDDYDGVVTHVPNFGGRLPNKCATIENQLIRSPFYQLRLHPENCPSVDDVDDDEDESASSLAIKEKTKCWLNQRMSMPFAKDEETLLQELSGMLRAVSPADEVCITSENYRNKRTPQKVCREEMSQRSDAASCSKVKKPSDDRPSFSPHVDARKSDSQRSNQNVFKFAPEAVTREANQDEKCVQQTVKSNHQNNFCQAFESTTINSMAQKPSSESLMSGKSSRSSLPPPPKFKDSRHQLMKEIESVHAFFYQNETSKTSLELEPADPERQPKFEQTWVDNQRLWLMVDQGDNTPIEKTPSPSLRSIKSVESRRQSFMTVTHEYMPTGLRHSDISLTSTESVMSAKVIPDKRHIPITPSRKELQQTKSIAPTNKRSESPSESCNNDKVRNREAGTEHAGVGQWSNRQESSGGKVQQQSTSQNAPSNIDIDELTFTYELVIPILDSLTEEIFANIITQNVHTKQELNQVVQMLEKVGEEVLDGIKMDVICRAKRNNVDDIRTFLSKEAAQLIQKALIRNCEQTSHWIGAFILDYMEGYGFKSMEHPFSFTNLNNKNVTSTVKKNQPSTSRSMPQNTKASDPRQHVVERTSSWPPDAFQGKSPGRKKSTRGQPTVTMHSDGTSVNDHCMKNDFNGDGFTQNSRLNHTENKKESKRGTSAHMQTCDQYVK